MCLIKCFRCGKKIQSAAYGAHKAWHHARASPMDGGAPPPPRECIDLTGDSDAETEPWPGLVGEPRIIPAQAGGAQEHYEQAQRARSPPPPSSSSPPAAQPEEPAVFDDDATSGGYELHVADDSVPPERVFAGLPVGLRKAIGGFAPRRALALAAAMHAAPAAPVKFPPRKRKTVYHDFPRRSIRKASHVLSVARPPGGHHRW